MFLSKRFNRSSDLILSILYRKSNVNMESSKEKALLKAIIAIENI